MFIYLKNLNNIPMNFKKIMLLCAILCAFNNCYSQSEKWHYYNYASSGQCAISSYKDMVFDNAGNTYAVGIKLVQPTVSSFCFMQANVIVDKFDATGMITASYQFDYNSLEEDDIAVSIKLETSTNKIFVLAYSHSFNILLKLNTNLQQENEKRFYELTPVVFRVANKSVYISGNTSDGAATLRYKSGNLALINYSLYEGAHVNDGELTTNGYAVTGNVTTTSNGTALYVQQFDSILNLSWTKTFNKYTGNYADDGRKIKVAGNNIYVGGNCESATTSNIGIILKLNSTGTVQWNKLLPNTVAVNDYATFTDLAPDPYSQDIYVVGYKTNTRIFKYNSSGTKFWDTDIITPVGTTSSGFNSIVNNGSGTVAATTIYLAGTNSYPGPGGFLTFERCYTYWATTNSGAFVYSDYDEGTGSTFDPSFFFTLGRLNNKVVPNLYVAVGNGRTEAGNPQASGTVGFIDCYNLSGPVPRKNNSDEDQRFSVFPNPAKDEITVTSNISYERIMLTDLNGKVMQSANSTGQETKLNIKDLSAGMYLIHIYNNGGDYTKKFFIEK
jgi:hypothetical protein